MQTIVGLENAVERVPVEQVGKTTASAIHRVVLNQPWLRKTADVLHGTWLGHPLHPVLTDFTIGAWMLGGAFDAVGVLRNSPEARWTGDRLAAIGTACAVPTALAGMTDFSTLDEGAERVGTLHALLNGLNFALYGLSLYERRWGNHRRGLAYSWAAQGLMLASAWLGGRLVYTHKVGVDHRETFTGPNAWLPVIEDAKLLEGTPMRVDVGGSAVLLYRRMGEIFAIGAVCSHAGGPLDEGSFREDCVQCPWHDSVFDLRDGHVVHGPATFPQQSFNVRVKDGMIELLRAQSDQP